MGDNIVCEVCERIIIKQSDMFFCGESEKIVCKTCFLKNIQEQNNEE